MRDRQANRRIRLLLAVFALAFAAMFARAFWLQAVQAAHLAAPRDAPAPGDRRRSPRGAARSSTAPASSSRSASRRRRSTPIRSRWPTPLAIALAAHTILGVNANALYPRCSTRRASSSTSSASPIPQARRSSSRRASRASPPTPRSCAPTRRAPSAPRWSATPGVDETGLGGLELQYNQQARRPGRQADDRPRPDRARDRGDQLAARCRRARTSSRRSTT